MGQAIKRQEHIWSKAKKSAKFVWRHILTLYILSVIVRGIFAGPIQGENACGFLLGAIFFDWAKQFIKPRPYGEYYPSHLRHDDRPLNIQQWWNPYVGGSAANIMEIKGPNYDR